MVDKDEKFMRLAIQKAREGVANGQTPFGACIVKANKIIACAHNIVWKSCDITAHAEINAIRIACKKLKAIDLSGCTIYSTCEPCPMCFSASHWAKISRIVFGVYIKDAKHYGFNELTVSNRKLATLGKSRICITKGVLRKENLELFEYWKRRAKANVY